MNLHIDPLQWAIVFSAILALDLVWAKYTRAIADKLRGPAVLHSVIIIGLTVIATANYAHDLSLAVPAMAGAGVGTWIGMIEKD